MRAPKVTLTRKENGYYAMEHVQPKPKFKIGDVVAPISDFEFWNTLDEASKFVSPLIVIGLKLKNRHGQGYWEYELHDLSEYSEGELTWHPCPDAEKIRAFRHILPTH